MPITEKTLLFLDENHHRNDREWFHEHKKHFQELVEAPLLSLSEALGPTIHSIDSSLETRSRRTLSRIWKDTRFSKDKTIFKKSVWITFQREKGLSHPVYFFEISSQMHRYGCGYYSTPAVVMSFIRQQIVENKPLFLAAQQAMEAVPHFKVEGDLYKRAKYPEYPAEKREWLERKSITVMHTSEDHSALFSPDLATTVSGDFLQLAPVYDFLTHCHTEALKEQEFRRFAKGTPL